MGTVASAPKRQYDLTMWSSRETRVSIHIRGAEYYIAFLIATAIVSYNIYYVASNLGLLHSPTIFGPLADHHRYLAMAQGPENCDENPFCRLAPYCYRILTPWVVYLLTKMGLDSNLAFFLLTHTFLVLFLFTLYGYLRSVGIGVYYALLGLALTGMLQGAVRWYGVQYWMPDPMSLFLLTLAFYLIKKEKTVWLFIVSAIAVTNRETHILVFPYYFLYHLKRGGVQSAATRTVLIAGIPLAILLVIRSATAAFPEEPVIATMQWIVAWRFQNFWNSQLYYCTVGAFGVIFPLWLLFPGKLIAHWKKNYDQTIVIVIVYATLLVGVNTDRLLAYAIPAVLPIAIKNLRAFIYLSRLPAIIVAFVVLLLQAVFYFQTLFLESMVQPVNFNVTISLVLFWIGCIGIVVFRRGKRLGCGRSPR